MRLARYLKVASTICFVLLWIPFVIALISSSPAPGPDDESPVLFLLARPWLMAMGVLFAGTFVFYLASLFFSATANWQTISKGEEAEAKIVTMRDNRTRINNDLQVEFALEVHPRGLPVFTAQATKTVSMIELAAYQPGRTVIVKFIPGTANVAIVGPKYN